MMPYWNRLGYNDPGMGCDCGGRCQNQGMGQDDDSGDDGDDGGDESIDLGDTGSSSDLGVPVLNLPTIGDQNTLVTTDCPGNPGCPGYVANPPTTTSSTTTGSTGTSASTSGSVNIGSDAALALTSLGAALSNIGGTIASIVNPQTTTTTTNWGPILLIGGLAIAGVMLVGAMKNK